MSLVPLVSETEPPAEVASTFESGREQYGKVLNTWRVIAHRPEAFVAYLPFLRSIIGPGALDQRIKELVAVRTSLLNRCRYTLSHRLRSARAAGVPEEDLKALADGELERFSAEEQAALEFARQLTLDPPQAPYAERPTVVDPDLLKRLKSMFGDAELVDLALNVSVWNALARFHRVMDLDLDMDAPPPEMERLL